MENRFHRFFLAVILASYGCDAKGKSDNVQTTVPSFAGGRVEGGVDHSLFRTEAGELWAMGKNASGELGNGTHSPSSRPIIVALPALIARVVSSSYFGLALTTEGAVWAWGANGVGQLGLGMSGIGVNGILPAKVPDFDQVRDIAAGFNHGLACKTDGTVWAWGHNWDGQLGIGAHGPESLSESPIPVPGLEWIQTVSAGDRFSLALDLSGRVWSFGRNGYGQLGRGDTDLSDVPVLLSGLSKVIAVACGYSHSLALREDGTVFTWGLLGEAFFGNGGQFYSTVPVPVPNLNDVVQIAAGDGNSLALKNDGTVWVWGGAGLLIGNTVVPTPTPTQVPGLSGIVGIGCGRSHFLVVRGDGSVWGWGSNGGGALGESGFGGTVLVPVRISF